ncbi:uncharacterized protein LOC122038480 isoform X2 [Zingiber officinale]|uniref:uncharacterized protein LOC122038480 isoform X2 n=1 Tax=Zingiber officinale TaxID=94328 RepID=UPI001C4B4956|nr:uncharacterized protein LOC122038480 isoform X2 [Zingiber officinale]
MGNRGRPTADVAKREKKKKKKKGRPSLLDLQKRSLRQQQQQNKPSPNPNPNRQFPQSSSRRATRRNPNPLQEDPRPSLPQGDEDENEGKREEGGGSGAKRKEKKLKFVLNLPSRSAGSSSDSEGPEPKRSKTSHGDRDTKGESNIFRKATDSIRGGQADLGPTTPLPDQKLLVFILDRLQKKDTYGVFSEPVDPEELPDYHEVIEEPMDFGTVRMKLLGREYNNLEQFENDVYLISSNAMRYNAPDTIYFRQARVIQELAKKNFENLRHESDDNEPEAKTVIRRGRPPSKNKKVGQPPALCAVRGLSSDATVANAWDGTKLPNLAKDFSRTGVLCDNLGVGNTPFRALYGGLGSSTFGWIPQQNANREDESLGSALRGVSRVGKKLTIFEENRRDTHKQSSIFSCIHKSPISTTFDAVRKQLVPVGLHLEFAYARSLARFAAKLGPIGWVLAAKRIQMVLPPGTKFGPGWVVENGSTHNPKSPMVVSSSNPLEDPGMSGNTSTIDKYHVSQEIPPRDSVAEEGHINRSIQPASSVAPNAISGSSEDPLPVRGPNGSISLVNNCSTKTIPSKVLRQNQNPEMQPIINGLNSACDVNSVSEFGKMARPAGIPSGHFDSDALVKNANVAHAQDFDMLPKSSSNNLAHTSAGRQPSTDDSIKTNSSSSLPDPCKGSKCPLQGVTVLPTLDSSPPDLNVGFQPPGSSASGVVVDQNSRI